MTPYGGSRTIVGKQRQWRFRMHNDETWIQNQTRDESQVFVAVLNCVPAHSFTCIFAEQRACMHTLNCVHSQATQYHRTLLKHWLRLRSLACYELQCLPARPTFSALNGTGLLHYENKDFQTSLPVTLSMEEPNCYIMDFSVLDCLI